MSFDQDHGERANISGADFAIMVSEIKALQSQCNDLLAALRQVRDLVDAYGSEDDNNTVSDAIAKATGSEA